MSLSFRFGRILRQLECEQQPEPRAHLESPFFLYALHAAFGIVIVIPKLSMLFGKNFVYGVAIFIIFFPYLVRFLQTGRAFPLFKQFPVKHFFDDRMFHKNISL